ncbi:MAG: hypothetical protein LH469_07275 [Frankiaceae bacterium]|nr:hypothetical protein [Frankiaceae bacterium]
MSGPASRREHKQFCDIEGWDTVLNAGGKKVSHHITLELALDDGRILRTRISRPANNDTYGPSLWTAILRDQLDATEDAFWDCVERQVLPPRPGNADSPAAAGLPASLVHQLKGALGLNDADIAVLSKDEAVARMTAFWSQPPT